MTSGQETDRAYSHFGASKICHILTYLDTYPLTARGPTWSGKGEWHADTSEKGCM